MQRYKILEKDSKAVTNIFALLLSLQTESTSESL